MNYRLNRQNILRTSLVYEEATGMRRDKSGPENNP